MTADLQKPVPASLKGLLTLAWPIIVSRSTQAVVGTADALMVAHLGTKVLAAATTGAMNSFALMIFPMGISFIVASFASQLHGKGDPVSARRYGWYGLGIALLAQVLAFVSIPLLPAVIGRLDYEPEVAAALILYMSIRLLSTGPAIGIEALGNYFGGLGNTTVLMRTNVVAMALNIPFNWVLINGHLGFPALGLRGAAMASVAATSLAFTGFLIYFLCQSKFVENSRLKLSEFIRMMRFGLPAGVNWAFEFFAFIAFLNIVVAGLGTVSLAAMMAVFQVNAIAFMPAFGIGSAGAILVGQAIGAGKKNEVPGLAFMAFKVAAWWMGVVGIFYFVFPQILLEPFVPAGPDRELFLAVGIQLMLLAALWQVVDAGGITYSEALRAAGDTTFTMWARGILAWVVFFPGSFIHVKYFGGSIMAAMAWLMFYLCLLAFVLYWRFRGGAWRKIELVEEAPVV